MNIKDTWNLSGLFKSDDDPEILIERKKVWEEVSKFVSKWREREDYLKDPTILALALSEFEEFENKFGALARECYYFNLRSMQDQNDSEIKAKYNQAISEGKKIQNELQFFELAISRIDEKLHGKFLESPELQRHRHYLEKLFAWKPYLLSEDVEKVLNLKESTAYDNWVRMTEGFLSKEEREITVRDQNGEIKKMRYKKEKKNFSEILALTSDADAKVRDDAAVAVNEILAKNVDAAEAELNSVLQDKKINDELRKLPRPDFGRHLNDDVDSNVVDVLIDSVSKAFRISKKFYVFKAKLFKLPKLTYFNRVVPFGKVEKKYSFFESEKIVESVFERLDPEFAGIFNAYLGNGQVDVFPKKNRAGGASCWHNLITQPGYVFLNHMGRLQDVLTIAHEFGHAINNELMRKKQHGLTFHTPLSTAEVASTFTSDFVLSELVKEADDELRLEILMMKLDEDMGTIFRQAAGYRFETELHLEFRKKGYLAKEEIGRMFVAHMQSYLGEVVEFPKGAENWWVHWSHFRYYFYIYSYVSGQLISKSLQASVREDPGFIFKVKEFLATGISDSPKNIFAKMGVDISDPKFWNIGIGEIEKLLEEAERLAKKLGKI